MNALLLNREGFQMPVDGWYQVAPIGEFVHAQAGLVQVVDREACEAMVNRFQSEAKAANFAGLLVDFDHFSLDGEKRSEAAGWITALENREGGLFAKIRWSDVGEEAVKGGRYRFLSPVWSRTDCVDLGNGRVRPVRLLNAAVTNDPNLKGMLPLSNSATAAGAPAGAAEPQRFKWVLGVSPGDRHCPSCTAVAGQVHTMAEWEAAGVKPGAGGLFCKGNCHCSLEPTTEAATGAVAPGPMRKETEGVKDDVTNSGKAAGEPGAGRASLREVLANVGWTDEARAASLAVRRAKAAARKGSGGKDDGKGGKDDEGKDPREDDYLGWFEEEGMTSMTPKAIEALTDQIRQKLADGKEPLSEVEEGFLEELTGEGYAGENDGDPIFNWQEKRAQREQQVLESTGMDFRDARAKVSDLELKVSQGKALTPEEKALVDTYNDIMSNRAVGAGESDEADVVYLVNTGWTDEARVAALAVRRAKTGVREQKGQQAGMVMPPGDGQVYLGGSPYFDERTGQYVYPVMPELPPGQGRPVPKPGVPVVPRPPGKKPVKPSPPGKQPVKPSPPYWSGPPGGRYPLPIDPPYRILPYPPRGQAPGRRVTV